MSNGTEDLSHLPVPLRYSLPEWLYERLSAQAIDEGLFQALLKGYTCLGPSGGKLASETAKHQP
jgi:hypothetical protein